MFFVGFGPAPQNHIKNISDKNLTGSSFIWQVIDEIKSHEQGIY
jgi:hypothetical protein